MGLVYALKARQVGEKPHWYHL